MYKLSLLLFMTLLSVSGVAQDVPGQILYQGRIGNVGKSGKSFNLGLEVRLYNAESGGDLVWGPQIFNGKNSQGQGDQIEVNNGYFSLLIGPQDVNGKSLIEGLSGDSVYLELREISPRSRRLGRRQRILSEAFALRSQEAIFSLSSQTAITAETATNATNAENAITAQTAVTAQSATTAETAQSAQTAITAETATNAINAENAVTAQTAVTAQSAITAETAQSAQTAITAETATNAINAENANGLLGSDGQAYGWDALFDSGRPNSGKIKSDLIEVNTVAESALTTLFVELARNAEWPLFTEAENLSYQATLNSVRSLVGSSFDTEAEYEDLRFRLNQENDSTTFYSISTVGGLPELELKMVWVDAVTNTLMGSPGNEVGRSNDETQRSITLTNGYWLGQFEVTQSQWKVVMGNSLPNGIFIGDGLPVYDVTHAQATEFCDRLNAQIDNIPAGYVFKLPTEAQWEVASRAGTVTRFSFGNDLLHIDMNHYGWSAANSLGQPRPVGMLKPNPWGFYDISGNVYEYTRDFYAAYSGPVIDPEGPASGSSHVRRGGAFTEPPEKLRSAARSFVFDGTSIATGFRVALVAE